MTIKIKSGPYEPRKKHEFDSLPWPEFHIQPGDLVQPNWFNGNEWDYFDNKYQA